MLICKQIGKSQKAQFDESSLYLLKNICFLHYHFITIKCFLLEEMKKSDLWFELSTSQVTYTKIVVPKLNWNTVRLTQECKDPVLLVFFKKL